jgi:acyl-homoserine lactone acylase PvdQ
LFELQVFLKPQVQRKRKTRKAATQVTIIRDNWGIPHVYGKTDADAVLACYAQCEDDFLRIEMNYIEKIRSLIGNKGQSVLYNDLETRLIIDEKEPE